jgi:hypothetical protein
MSLFTISGLRNDAILKVLQKLSVPSEYPPEQRFDIFMSHSILDADIIDLLKIKIEFMGYKVYVDRYVDKQLDRSKVDKDTARLLRNRMQKCSCLFFATSDNSMHSVWMPWELGYFDALKRKVAILPLPHYPDNLTDLNLYYGQEYLGLYPYVTIESDKDNVQRLWIQESLIKSISLNEWLQRAEPQEH